jgi:hypothetical protein
MLDSRTTDQRLLMVRRDPPVRAYRPQTKNRTMVELRRQQLKENPETWFVWQEGAKNRSYERKALWLLLNMRQGEKFSKKDSPYQTRLVQDDNGTFTIFVRYVAKENPEQVVASVSPINYTVVE